MNGVGKGRAAGLRHDHGQQLRYVLPCTRIRSEMLYIAKGLAEKTKDLSQLHASVSGGRCTGYFGAAEGQHTRIAPVWNIVPHFKVGVEESPLPKVPLGTAAVRSCWHSRLYQALSMRCNGRREPYLPFLGGNGCPTSSIILLVRGVIVEFLCSPLAPCCTRCGTRPVAHPALAVSCN